MASGKQQHRSDSSEPPASGWFKLYNGVAVRILHEIGDAGLAVYCVLGDHSNAEMQAWPSMVTICKEARKSKSTVPRAIKALEAAGFITVERPARGGKVRHNIYTITPHAVGVTSVPGPQTDNVTSVPGGVSPAYLEQEPLKKTPQTRPREAAPPSSRKLHSDEADMATARWMLGKLREQMPGFKQPNLDRWANKIRLMRERDNRVPEDIRAVFEWANADSFWQSNILSPAKLREKFDQLNLKRKNPSNESHKRNGQAGSTPGRIPAAAGKYARYDQCPPARGAG